MADDKETKQKNIRDIADMRNAMMEKDYKEVRRLYGNVPEGEGPLQRISIYDDTVLHMATHSQQHDLVGDLLNMIPADHNQKLSDIKNANGNTILHEVAASDAMKHAAEELLKRNDHLLTASNQGLKNRPSPLRLGATRVDIDTRYETMSGSVKTQ